ncbi:uncharacterized protein LOC135222153 isoform X2 [Macrobrachium nipponense]|uniref:uncharacterized protein LOC135222153 isoform X2 n=1 Tax=Macrobrachium nipponense TaxID=159736 RepID=UPI0030C8101C
MAKKWGRGEFWGLGSDYDPDWVLTEEQKKLRDDLIDLCRRKIRPLSVEYDQNYTFPRESMNALAELGLLGLVVPKELGGRGENHVCMAMVVETIARYGCPSTAMVYTMHLLATCIITTKYHDSLEIRQLLSRLDRDKLVGTTAFSDPATGGHFWYQISCKARMVDEDTMQVLKYGSWCTSAGHADWYTISINSPDFDGDHTDLALLIAYAIIEEIAPLFGLVTAGCWNGISMGCMDLAKKHVTRKAHADLGLRICDYATIQDYFGESLAQTSASRLQTFLMAQRLDQVTGNCDWEKHSDPNYTPRLHNEVWLWQVKYIAAHTVYQVSDRMLQACGGTGYKTEMGLERLLRDGRAGWLMSPSNEFLRSIIGKVGLMGIDSFDPWEQSANDRVIHNEVQKLSLEQKRELAQSLLDEVAANEKGKVAKHPFQDTDFENPSNTCPPAACDKGVESADGVRHEAAMSPDSWITAKLLTFTRIGQTMGAFKFSLPKDTDHTGCKAGQYVAIKVTAGGRDHIRYFSPVSCPDDYGHIDLVMKFETQGIMSKYFSSLKPGDAVLIQGPCGGFEYDPNKLDQLTLVASGGGITPGLQLIRSIIKDPKDKTKIKLLYHSETLDDVLFKKELDHFAAQDERLQIVYTLGSAPEDWEAEEGFIDTQMIDKHVPKPNGLKQKIVMCGGPTMVISCLHSLKSLRFPSQDIFVYGPFGTELVRSVFGRNTKLSGHSCSDL